MAMGLHRFGGGRRPRGRGARAPMAEINVTPLVDVMMVLLVIFMVTAPLLKAAVPINLPDSRAQPMDQTAHQMTIAIDNQGNIYLDDTLLAPGELAERLGSVARGGDGQLPLVTLRADRSLDYGRVIAVMGELNHAGFNRISLVTGTGPSASGPEASDARTAGTVSAGSGAAR
jgi:biopolymer transport protein TolR